MSKSGIIKFKVQPIASSGSPPLSQEITLTITEDPMPPMITNYILDETMAGASYQATNPSQKILTDTDDKFTLEPFYCDTATCVVTNYSISTSNLAIVSPLGLSGPSLNSETGLIEITVDDTSILGVF